jgi:hypothetical protein
MLGTFIGLLPTVLAVAGLGALVRDALVHPTLPNLLLAVGASLLLVTAAALIRTLLLIRRFAPTLASHRAQAEFG